LACVVLTKMMLPIEHRTNFSNALLFLTSSNNHHDHIPNNILLIRTYTIDVLYSTTSLVSGTVLAITLSFMRSNVRRIQLYNSNNLSDGSSTGNTGNHSPSFHTSQSTRSIEGV
jgi:hypothetical protein